MDIAISKETDRKFVETIESIAEYVEGNLELIGDDLVYSLSRKVENISVNIDEKKAEGRLLKIGIIGCVKAGKSSFLNALVFDGDEILPKAPTPMTAALTKISYSEIPEAKVVFYKKYDWENIQKLSEKFKRAVDEEYARQCENCKQQMLCQGEGAVYSIIPYPKREDVERKKKGELPESWVSSFELVTMAERQHLNVGMLLGKEEVIYGDPGDPSAGYSVKLADYVGADGKYTPIVNHIELSINNPLLEGLEIIDTPGLNDPIVSRSKATKDYLMSCDVVFIVCQVGQFLTKQDVELISKELCQEGVAHAYIIGSQLDSGILQYNRREHSLDRAYNGSLNTYEQHAESELEKLAKEDGSKLVRQLRDTLPPEFVSAMMYGIAKKMKNKQPFTSDEENVLNNFQTRFTDFQAILATPDDFYQFANIQGVKERVYKKVLAEKQSIQEEVIANFTSDQAGSLIGILEDINIAANINLKNLRNGDIEQIEAKLRLLNAKMNSIRVEVKNIFENQAVMCRREIQSIKQEISREVGRHTDISIETETENVRKKEDYGFLGLSKRISVYCEKRKIASAHEAVENVRQYGTEAQGLINSNLRTLFDEDGLQERLKKCVVGAFDLADESFSADEILLPLNTLLKNITFSPIQFDFISDAEDAIYGEFAENGGRVEGDKIHALYKAQEQQLNSVLCKLAEGLDKTCANIQVEMDKQSGIFVDDIIKKVSRNIEATKRLLSHREKNIAKYEELIKAILLFKKDMLEF